jgi:predicted acylesterase/phospholipase RssA
MKYDLVFEGGGAKGMAFVGACQELFGRGHGFERLLGTSAGAITATLLAAGYTPDEMLAVLTEKADGKSVFATFMGVPPDFTEEELADSAVKRVLEGIRINLIPGRLDSKLDAQLLSTFAASERFRNVMALIERGGWYGAERFLSWLRAKLDTGRSAGGERRFSHMTLSQLFDTTKVELSVVASDASDARMLVLNHRTAPQCPVVWAVRMSMSIPLLWDEVIWRADWGSYLDRDITGHAIVDGGLLSNFPLELFISDEPHVTKLMGPKGTSTVLGLLIDERLPVAAARGLLVSVNLEAGELRTLQRLKRLVDAATTARDKMVIDEYSHLVARLPAQGYGTTEFDMPDARRSALVQAGRAALAAYLDAPSAAARPRGRGGPATGVATAADRVAVNILQ